MKIRSKTAGMINGVRLKIGTFDYPFDVHDPSTAMQLEVLRDQAKTITFGERLPCDIEKAQKLAAEKKASEAKPPKAKVEVPDVRSDDEPTKGTRKHRD